MLFRSSGIPERGPLSSTVPGVVAGWQELHRRFGRLPWATVLAPAISAADGFPVSKGLAEATAQHREVLKMDPALAGLLLSSDRPLSPGSVLRQPALATTLEEIASGGAEAFCCGRAAGSLSRLSQSKGGLLRETDFQNCRPEWVEPLQSGYRDLQRSEERRVGKECRL